MAMKTSSTVDSNSSWTEPLLVPTSTIDREGQDESKQDQDGEKDSKFIKRSQQLHVHRLLSFLFGSMVGIGLQVASVVVFARLVQHAQLRYGDDIAANLRQAMENTVTATTTTSSEQTMARYEAILKSEDSTWFNMAIWVVYHASLSVYLIIWASMMTMAVSKVGWRCISSGLRIPSKVTRRTCFLRTFFFINGTFLQQKSDFATFNVHDHTSVSHINLSSKHSAFHLRLRARESRAVGHPGSVCWNVLI